MAKTNFSSNAFMKGVTSETPPSSTRDGLGFRPRKTVLWNTTPSTRKAAPRDVVVVKAFSQENPQHSARPGPRDKASYMRRRRRCRPDNPHRPINPEDHRHVGCHNSRKSCDDRHHLPLGPWKQASQGRTRILVERQQHLTPRHRSSRRPSLTAAAATRQIRSCSPPPRPLLPT